MVVPHPMWLSEAKTSKYRAKKPWRHRAIETAGISRGLPANDFRHRNHAAEERLRIFLGQNIEYLAAVRSPMLFKISQEPHRQTLDDLPATEQQRLHMATYGHFRVWT
jgi:hypothetical protein